MRLFFFFYVLRRAFRFNPLNVLRGYGGGPARVLRGCLDDLAHFIRALP